MGGLAGIRGRRKGKAQTLRQEWALQEVRPSKAGWWAACPKVSISRGAWEKSTGMAGGLNLERPPGLLCGR